MRLTRVTEVHHRPGGYYFKVWRSFPAVFAVSISTAVCLCLIAFLEQSQPEFSVFHFLYAAIAAVVVFVGLLAYHIWKSFQRSEWGIYIDPDGLFINTRPALGRFNAGGEAKVIHLACRDIDSARQIDDIARLYPGSFRHLEKSTITALELTVRGCASAELRDWLKYLSLGPRLDELIIVPILLDDKALMVYWRNEDLLLFPECARALDALGEYGVAIADTVTVGSGLGKELNKES